MQITNDTETDIDFEENHMNEKSDYDRFTDGLTQYGTLWQKGLKKQANQFLKQFTDMLTQDWDKASLDTVLERFCRELCDGRQFDFLTERGNGSLPYALNGLVWQYLKDCCDKNLMPQMRFAYQIYGNRYNPFNPGYESDVYHILKKAYEHPQCDHKTAELYFQAQLDTLGWGAHHFPDGCIITKQLYLDTVSEAERILTEHSIRDELVHTFSDLHRLYQCYERFEASGKKCDFYRLCKESGISFYPMKTYYYDKEYPI